MAKVKYILIVLLLCCQSVDAAKYVDTIQGQDAAGCWDAFICEDDGGDNLEAVYNYGGTDTIRIDATTDYKNYGLFWFTNMDTIPTTNARKIDSVILACYTLYRSASVNADVYVRKKGQITEGTSDGDSASNNVSWTDWNAPFQQWGLAGADSAYTTDTGLQNNADGGASAYIDSNNVPTASLNGGMWEFTDSIYSSDNKRAAIWGTNQDPRNPNLNTYGYGFSLLAGDIVDSIKVSYEGYFTTSEDFRIYLTKNASTSWTLPGTAWTPAIKLNSDSLLFGNPSALWGQTWTPAEINAHGFGVIIYDAATSGRVYCDQVMVTVYYRSVGPDRGYAYMSRTAVPAATNWIRMKIDTALSQDWFDGSLQPFGVIIKAATANRAFTFASSEHPMKAYRPRWIIYSSDNLLDSARRRRMALMGMQ